VLSSSVRDVGSAIAGNGLSGVDTGYEDCHNCYLAGYLYGGLR
jgi:hypothetical protein